MLRKKGDIYEITCEGKLIGEYNTKSQAKGAEEIINKHKKDGTLKDWLKDLELFENKAGRKVAVLSTSKKLPKKKAPAKKKEGEE